MEEEFQASFGADDTSSEDVSLSILEPDTNTGPAIMTRYQAWNLFTSHFLSTWNMRMYEFAAIIFTAAAYPNTLLAASIRGIVRTLASICFSSLVGRWVDRSPDRLKALTTTIVTNRLAVMTASTLWFFILKSDDDQPPKDSSWLLQSQQGGATKIALFSAVLFFGILETLSAGGNTLCMERDWIVVASSPDGKPYDLTQLNSAMRRIDLICKLLAPIFISAIISTINIEIGVLVVGGMSALSILAEWWCARRVWKHNPRLRTPKIGSHQSQNLDSLSVRTSSPIIFFKMSKWSEQYVQDLTQYFTSVVWIPSLALALLHISALAYSATLITFLINCGFSLDIITIARAAGSVVEISSTVVTPIGVNYLSKVKNQERLVEESATALLEVEPEERSTEIGLFRLGLWGISWQLINLIPVTLSVWSLSSLATGMPSAGPNFRLSFTLFFFLSTSRIGLWIYDLTTQQLTQTMTSQTQRSSFAGVENSFVALFELMQNVVAIILHKPEQFKWIASMSWIAVALSTVMYSGWVRTMRGHLLHWDMVRKGCECVRLRLNDERRRFG